MIDLCVRGRSFCLAAMAAAALLATRAASAQTTTLFYEDFSDAELAPNAMLFVNEDSTAVVENGVAKFVDALDRSGFSVLQPFDEPLMTFQFDFAAPVIPNATTDPPSTMEVVMRAGVGDTHRTLQNAEQVVEAIAFRGVDPAASSRVGEMIENKTVFLAYNNKDTEQTFTSPVDGTPVTLGPYQYVPYAFDRPSMTFTAQPKGVSNTNPAGEVPPRDITRLAIGSSSSGHQGTFAIDNVLVRTGLVFDRNFPSAPPPALVGDFDGNKIVNGADLGVWKTSFSANAGADADKDGDSDGNDFLLWQLNLGAVAPVPVTAAAAVPEPAAGLLAAGAILGAVGLGRRRRPH